MSDYLRGGSDPGPLAFTAHTPSVPLLHEQNHGWREGRRVLVEDYLAPHPWLRSDPESLLDLIYNEIRLREELGETPEFDDYVRRFPGLCGPVRIR
jgi:hypothetical protein